MSVTRRYVRREGNIAGPIIYLRPTRRTSPDSDEPASVVGAVSVNAEAKETSGSRDHDADEEDGSNVAAGTATLPATDGPAPAIVF